MDFNSGKAIELEASALSEGVIAKQNALIEQGAHKRSYVAGVADPDSVNKMRNIKDSFTAKFDSMLQKTTRNLAYEAQNNPEMDRAIHTRQVIKETPQGQAYGVQTKNFEVFAIPQENGGKRYEIANVSTGQKLIGGVLLHETAESIVKLLNKGWSFYSPEVSQVLKLEEGFAKHFNEAASLKRQASGGKNAIMEAKFQEAKRKAVEVRRLATDLNNRIK